MIKQAIVKNILFSGLIAGTLDISAAILFLANGNAAGVLKYIASGAFGKDAFTGGDEMLAWGVLFPLHPYKYQCHKPICLGLKS